MGAVTYYFFKPKKGRNNRHPWAIAYNVGGWYRSCVTRGWTWERQVYVRATTEREDEWQKGMKRHYGGRYESLDKLLEDELDFLAKDSEEFRKLETALRRIEEKYLGVKIMNLQTAINNCRVEGNMVKTPETSLDRDVYLKLADKLKKIGGKWKGGKTQAFVFDYDPSELLADLQNGKDRNIKKEFQFYESPEPVVKRIVELGEIEPEHVILEPSAGYGRIIREVSETNRFIAYEINDICLNRLDMLLNCEVRAEDFLNAPETELYDRILANPPFSKNQDIAHIRKMWKVLKPGGILVSVASLHWKYSKNRVETEFAEWLKETNAYVEELPPDAFKESGAMVATAIIKIKKPKDSNTEIDWKDASSEVESNSWIFNETLYKRQARKSRSECEQREYAYGMKYAGASLFHDAFIKKLPAFTANPKSYRGHDYYEFIKIGEFVFKMFSYNKLNKHFYYVLQEKQEPIMTTKKLITKKKKVADNSANKWQEVIRLEEIEVSPLESQTHRRARFMMRSKQDLENCKTPVELAALFGGDVPQSFRELAESIKKLGILQSPQVRVLPNGKKQGIFGERRLIAAALAGLKEVECVVHDLDDEQTAEWQLTENIQRVDLHPIDEAFSYFDMQKRLGIDEKEIAFRVNKDLAYVKTCLKFLALDETVMKIYEEDKMTFEHAREFAKYPKESQAELLPLCFSNYSYQQTQALYPVRKFVENIEQSFLRKLKKAPFPIKSTELREDKLSCITCPERTGAEPLFFSEQFSGEDSCLNKKCWNLKTAVFTQIQRRCVASDRFGADKAEKKISSIPLISSSYYLAEYERPKKDKVLTSEDWKEIKSKADDCEYSEIGVFYNGNRTAQKQKICTNGDCIKHWGKRVSGQMVAVGEASDDIATRKEARAIRTEEIFDARVAEPVRRLTLKKCAGKFDAEHTIFNHEKSVGFRNELLARLWKLQCADSSHTAKIIRDILELDDSHLGIGSWGVDYRTQILALPAETRERLFFLLITAFECEIVGDPPSYHSQKAIKELAQDFEVDYLLLDARERLAQAKPKQKDVYRDYLEQVERKETTATIPRPHSAKWKPVDD